MSSGYMHCSCGGCFETIVGETGDLCHGCEKAGCSATSTDCQADHCAECGAWEHHAEDCVGCEYEDQS